MTPAAGVRRDSGATRKPTIAQDTLHWHTLFHIVADLLCLHVRAGEKADEDREQQHGDRRSDGPQSQWSHDPRRVAAVSHHGVCCLV
jgi:hypothetical protein